MSEFDNTIRIMQERSQWTMKKSLHDLDDHEYNNVTANTRYLKRCLADLEEAIREVHIEKTVDFEKLVRHSKRRFSDIDIAILEMLLPLEGGCHVSYIADMVNATYDDTRKRLRRMRRLGLTHYFKGGWTEDGDMFGSGYSLDDDRRSIVERIVTSYQADKNQLKLLDETAAL